MLVREWGNCVPTYNWYRLPGKAQPTPNANIFTAAASWPESDKIFHTEEHHKDDLLPKIGMKQTETDEGGERWRRNKASAVWCCRRSVGTWTASSATCSLTTCHSNSSRRIDYFHRNAIYHSLICTWRHNFGSVKFAWAWETTAYLTSGGKSLPSLWRCRSLLLSCCHVTMADWHFCFFLLISNACSFLCFQNCKSEPSSCKFHKHCITSFPSLI